MPLYKKIFKALNLNDNSLVFDLTKTPNDKGELHHQAYDKDYSQQADLLFLPEDQGFKYALVVVDVATRKADAQPIKNKKPETVVKAIRKIWARPYINQAKIFLKVDDGTEFKGQFKDYMKKNNIILMRGKPGRSRGQAVAEYINLVIGKSIMMKQTNDELAEDEENTEWVDELPIIIKEYNEFIDEKEATRKQLNKPSRKETIYNEMSDLEEQPLLFYLYIGLF